MAAGSYVDRLHTALRAARARAQRAEAERSRAHARSVALIERAAREDEEALSEALRMALADASQESEGLRALLAGAEAAEREAAEALAQAIQEARDRAWYLGERSAELEVVYPELVRLADPRVARVTCTSCGATSAGELAACPSCGTAHPTIASASGPFAEEAQHEATRSLREIMRAKHEPI